MAVIYPQNRGFDKVAQIGQEKSAPECPFECGGGEVQKLKGQCPNARDMNLSGASLSAPNHPGKRIDPPRPNGQFPNGGNDNCNGSSLTNQG